MVLQSKMVNNILKVVVLAVGVDIHTCTTTHMSN